MTATALDTFRAAKRIVVKIGSALVADAGTARQAWLNALAADITTRRNDGQEVILVSSGAIALGRNQLGTEPAPQARRKTSRRGAWAAAPNGGGDSRIR